MPLDVGGSEARERQSIACPSCGARNPTGAVACSVCGWPFPTESEAVETSGERPAAAPGPYMGRDPALRQAAEREAQPGTLLAVWIAVQIVCALLFVLLLGGLLLGRMRPPGGVALVILMAVMIVGGRALWRYYRWRTRQPG
jgi:hypothetical protein